MNGGSKGLSMKGIKINNDCRVLSRNFGLGWKGAWHFHAQPPPPNH